MVWAPEINTLSRVNYSPRGKNKNVEFRNLKNDYLEQFWVQILSVKLRSYEGKNWRDVSLQGCLDVLFIQLKIINIAN